MTARATVYALLGLFAASGTTAADSAHTLIHQDTERRYELHLPGDAAAVPAPVPLVVSLHGYRQSLDSLRGWLRLAPVADREGFAVAYPEALDGRWSYGRPIVSPMPQAGFDPADDSGFIAAMIARLVAEGIADPARIYVAGLSRGGLMAFTLACTLADRLAAVAPMITGMTEYQIADCRPARAVPMFVLAGTADLAQRYDGWITAQGRLASVPETIEFWRKVHGCTGQKSAPLPNIVREDRSTVGVVRWTGCATDGALVYYRVFGGGHRLPSLAPPDPQRPGRMGIRNRDVETAEEIWKFFRNWRRAS